MITSLAFKGLPGSQEFEGIRTFEIFRLANRGRKALNILPVSV
jgi:hypothetical protein